MYPRRLGPGLMHGHYFLAFAIVHWVVGLIVLAGFVCFLLSVWRFTKAHEQIARSLKDMALVPKPKEPEMKE